MAVSVAPIWPVAVLNIYFTERADNLTSNQYEQISSTTEYVGGVEAGGRRKGKGAVSGLNVPLKIHPTV